MKNILLIARRECRLIIEDKWTAIVMLVAPLLAALVMGRIYSGRVVRDIPTMIVDHDRTPMSRLLARSMDASEHINVVRTDADERDVEAIMREGEIRFAVEIPKDFEGELQRGHQAHILCIANGTNIVEAVSVLKGANEVASSLSASVSIDKMVQQGVPSTHAPDAYVPLEVTERFLFNPAGTYSNFLLPGILIALLQQVVMVGAALTWAREFQEGIVSTLTSISTRLSEQIIGKLLPYVGIGLAWSAVFFGGIFGALEVPFAGSLIAGLVALVLMMGSMGLLAMVISAASPNKATAMQFVFIVSSPAFLVSGFTFPLTAMTAPVRIFAAVIPLTHFLAAWRRIVLYGAGFGEITSQLLILTLMIVAVASLTTWVVKRKVLAQPIVSGVQR